MQRAVTFTALTIAAACLVTANTRAQDAPAAGPLKLGFVDVSALFGGYARKAEFEADVNAKRKEMASRVKKEVDWANSFKEKMNKTSKADQDKLVKSQQRINRLKRQLQEQLKAFAQANSAKALGEIERSVHEFGKERGYTAIFKIQGPKPKAKPGEELYRSQTRDVYYCADEVDVTQEAMAYVNAEETLSRRRGKAAPPK